MKKIRIVANLLLVMLCFAIFPYGVYAAINISNSTITGALTIESLLPDNYTQLAYIQSTGTQYIDTGYQPSNSTKLYAKFASTTITSTSYMFGARTDATTNTCYLSNNDHSLYPRFGATSEVSISGPDLNIHTLSMSINGIEYDNNTPNNVSVSSAAFTCPYNIYIGCINEAGNVKPGFVKIYEFKLWDDSTLVRNFVPCTNSSGVAGLYDLVSGVFYDNDGTGTFTTGALN